MHSDVNQFSIITELLGTPPDDVIETICSENVGTVPRVAVYPLTTKDSTICAQSPQA